MPILGVMHTKKLCQTMTKVSAPLTRFPRAPTPAGVSYLLLTGFKCNQSLWYHPDMFDRSL